jgi:hypothetical protein
MSTKLLRKYLDILSEADETNQIVSQQELAQLYQRGKSMSFIKNTPVALATFSDLEKIVDGPTLEKISKLAGAVDNTSYSEAHRAGGYVVFQWNSNENRPDIYIASPDSVKSRYTKFSGQLPTDAKARSKVPSLVVLDALGLNASKFPFFVKKVPQEMVRADVQRGGYLTKNEKGMVYTVAPDAGGLPIGYIPA